MNKKLSALFNSIETQRSLLLDQVKLAPDKFEYKSSDEKWSVHQILAHLITAEKLSIQYIAKKIQGIDEAGNTGLTEELKMLVLKVSQRLPLKFKAPRAVVETTPTYSGIDELISEWDTVRENFKKLLAQFNDNQLKRKVYKHFFAGRLNIVHALLFLREHTIHHIPQINRLLK